MYKCDSEIQMKIDSCFSKAEILIHIQYLKFIVTATGLEMSLMVFVRITIWSFLLHTAIDMGCLHSHFTQHFHSTTEVRGFSHPNACKKQDEGKRYGNGLFQCCKSTVFLGNRLFYFFLIRFEVQMIVVATSRIECCFAIWAGVVTALIISY